MLLLTRIVDLSVESLYGWKRTYDPHAQSGDVSETMQETVTETDIYILFQDFVGKSVIFGRFPPNIFDLGLHNEPWVSNPARNDGVRYFPRCLRVESRWILSPAFQPFRLDIAEKGAENSSDFWLGIFTFSSFIWVVKTLSYVQPRANSQMCPLYRSIYKNILL